MKQITIGELEEKLEKLPSQIFEAEKKYLAAKEKYETISDAYDIQLAIEKVKVQRDPDISNIFAKDLALAGDVIQDLIIRKREAQTTMLKWMAVYNKLDREFFDVV